MYKEIKGFIPTKDLDSVIELVNKLEIYAEEKEDTSITFEVSIDVMSVLLATGHITLDEYKESLGCDTIEFFN